MVSGIEFLYPLKLSWNKGEAASSIIVVLYIVHDELKTVNLWKLLLVKFCKYKLDFY